MPMVPTTFVPGVEQQPTQTPRQVATPVLPMENRAPVLLEQIGAAVQGGGVSLMREGQDLRANLSAMLNDAQTKNADTQFLTSATKIADDYTRTLGNDAIQGYDGAAAALAKAKTDAQATLTNPLQLRNFNYLADQHFATLSKTINDHKFQQMVKFGADASNDRSDTMVQQAANSYSDWQRPDGKFATFKHAAVTESLHGAALLGLPPDSPQAQQIVKQKTTELARGVLTRMMDAEQYDEARTYYDKALEAGEIDERSAELLGNAIMEGHNSQKGKDAAEEEKQRALGGAADAAQQRLPLIPGSAIAPRITDTMGSPRPGGRVHDGIDIAIPTGSKLQAPADGTVTKVWNDDKFGGGLSMEITYPNGNVEGVAHLGTVNYQPGQKVTQGSIIALSGQSGNATGPSVHWSMRDKDGNPIDPRAAAPAAKDTTNFTDPDVFVKAIDGVNARTDLTQRAKDVAINQLRNDYGTAREIQSQQYQKVKGQAVDYYFQHNGSIDGLPASIRMQLKPEDAYNLTQPAAVKDDPDTRVSFILDPKSVTVDNVKGAFAAGKLSTGTYLGLLKDAVEGQSNPQKVMEATVEADRLKYFADQAGLSNIYSQQTPDQKRNYAQLLVRVQEDIDGAQQQKNGKLSQQEKDAIIQRDLQQHVITHLRSAWNPLAWVPGHDTYGTKVRGYQMPQGATGTAMGKDGKLHFTDGAQDLGVVPE